MFNKTRLACIPPKIGKYTRHPVFNRHPILVILSENRKRFYRRLKGGTDYMVDFKKILFPCDLTENAARISPYVLSVSEKYGGRIYLLFVVEDLPLFHPIPYVTMGWDQEKILADADKAVELFCRENLQKCPTFHKLIVSGDPAPAILKTIESKDIDLVVMGSHGRKGLTETIFGSVAENVLKKSPVPVLTVNPYRQRD
jgi:nucleotide-binding universal stress UspA family protein